MLFWAHCLCLCDQNGIVFPFQVGKLKYYACKHYKINKTMLKPAIKSIWSPLQRINFLNMFYIKDHFTFSFFWKWFYLIEAFRFTQRNYRRLRKWEKEVTNLRSSSFQVKNFGTLLFECNSSILQYLKSAQKGP